MGTALTSASSSTHAPGPNGQAAVLPLSITPDCLAPRSTTRSTIRCPFDDCRLIQFVTSNRLCRKCHRPLDRPVVIERMEVEQAKPPRSQSRSRRSITTPAIITTTDELDAIAIQAAKMPPVCPALARLDQCLPAVLCWLRTRMGLSQKQLADRAGIERPQMNAFENGRVMPSVETVKNLAAAMDTNMAHVVKMCEYLRDGR
jgi:DNA-binding XRE family transcriptional regulator